MTSSALPLTDAELIQRHLNGDAEAFRAIVERHQGAVCAVAYSICGNRERSEDIAQDTFIAGWKQATRLKEPGKLRSWLCGIARNVARNALRSDSRVPGARAEELPEDAASTEGIPSEQAIASDREALLWSAIASLPETYREPLVLFYREQKDVESVARALDLTEEAVRQRLSRARAMLAGRMTALVEETLAAGTPSRAFAAGVLMALPSAAPAAGAAAGPMAGSVATAGLLAKAIPSLAALPFLLSGFTNYLSFRAAYACASAGDRREVVKARAYPLMISGLIVSVIVLFFRNMGAHGSGWRTLGILAIATPIFLSLLRAQRKIPASRYTQAPAYEFRSRAKFLGLPLLHVRVGGALHQRRALGWIAISDTFAAGGLLASAPLSVAPFAMGGVPIGLLALGGFAVGVYAVGVAALGLQAAGLFATSLHLSLGLFAVSHQAARGAIAIAPHANDALAHAMIDASPISLVGRQSLHIGTWGCLFAWVPPLLLILAQGAFGARRGAQPAPEAR